MCFACPSEREPCRFRTSVSDPDDVPSLLPLLLVDKYLEVFLPLTPAFYKFIQTTPTIKSHQISTRISIQILQESTMDAVKYAAVNLPTAPLLAALSLTDFHL